MSLEQIRQSENREKAPILFATNETKANRLSLLSVYFQTFAYYDSILTNVAIPMQLLIFIYKYNILFYESSQIILLVICFLLNLWRLSLGRTGNKGKKYWHIFGYIIMTLVVIVGQIYVVAIQPNVLWLQFVAFLIALILTVTELLLMIVLGIYYRANEI